MERIRIQPLTAGCLALLLTGCYDLEQRIVLQEDLSGTLAMRVVIHGDADDPLSREEFEAEKDANTAEMRQQAEEQLPEGVELETVEFEWVDETKVALRMSIAFDHIRRLSAIRDDAEEGGMEPVSEFQVEETDKGWSIRMRIAEKREEGEENQLVPVSAFKDRTFLLVLDSKASISEHNGEADEERDGLVRWARKMTEVVDSPVDVYAEFTIER